MGWILEGVPGKFEQIVSDKGLVPDCDVLSALAVRPWIGIRLRTGDKK